MEFLHYQLSNVNGGDIVEVHLSSAANVCLLTTMEFYNYKSGSSFNYRGGYVTVSPYHITIPYSGTWHVTIDLGGYSGSVSCSVTVISQEKPVATESLKWQIQSENPDCTVNVTSRWLEKHPEYGDPNTNRTDFLVFDKKTGNLHKHYSIGEDTNWELKEWHDWR